MRLAANENVPAGAVAALRAAGHDVSWAAEDAPGSTDAHVLAVAVAQQRVVITFDKDFGHLAFHAGLPAACGVVLFRVRMRSEAAVTRIVVAALEGEDRWTGRFSVVEEDGRIRQRDLPASGRHSDA
jgi:predicted nuclease of predicted toxin-antitoxin system